MHHSLIKVAAQSAIITASILGTGVTGLAAGFDETDLVANKSMLTDSNGILHTPKHVDPNLLNPWGLTASPVATLYNADGVAEPTPPPPTAKPLVVSIPAPPPGDPLGNKGAPTGAVFNFVDPSQGAFEISGFTATGLPTKAPARFLFATEDGTIVAWNPGVNPPGFDPTKAGTYGIIAVDHSKSKAVYKGLAIATDALGTTRLYATNFHAGTVEVFNTHFLPADPVNGFTDPHLPRNYAPFNIVPVGPASATATAARLVVTFAIQDADKHDDVAGMSHGIVDTFDLGGHSLQRLIQHGQLNSPWGVAVAPESFGTLAGSLLIGNFGNGHINAYNATTGEFIDKIRNPHGQAIVIDGLWSLRVGSNVSGSANFGPDAVFFTAGPNGEEDGLFGTIAPK